MRTFLINWCKDIYYVSFVVRDTSATILRVVVAAKLALGLLTNTLPLALLSVLIILAFATLICWFANGEWYHITDNDDDDGDNKPVGLSHGY